MILKHLENANLNLEIRKQLEELTQIAKLHEKGWNIKPGTIIDWPSLSWVPLIKALDRYLKKYNGDIWRQQVGGAQLILPAHIINEYSHPNRANGFENCTWDGNNEGILPRTGVIDWKSVENGEYILGRDFAWARGDMGACEWRNGYGDNNYARLDVRAMDELMTARVQQAQLLLKIAV